jgi:MoaA/NifB/PqqE/SkfB family radical SAM enzyme
MNESHVHIESRDIGQVPSPATLARGSEVHREMLDVANPHSLGWRGYRNRYFDDYRLLKIRFMASQRGFPRRLANYVTFRAERGRVARVHYFPVYLTIDANSTCNLRCPGCATGIFHPDTRKKGLATLERMRRVIDEAYPRALQINFYHWGESLLNKDFYEACAHAAERGLWTTVHSNLSHKMPDLAEKVLRSRLHNLVISCDGATQEVYEKYRVRGDVDLVFDNLAAIAKLKKTTQSSFPWITAKFLIFDHNWHEMKAFRERAQAAGADEVMFAPAGMEGVYKTLRVGTGHEFNLDDLKWVKRDSPTSCSEMWDHFIMDYDGATWPCCIPFRTEDLFVSAEEANSLSLMEQWNHPNYVKARAYFADRAGKTSPDLPSPCDTCGITYAREAMLGRPVQETEPVRLPLV